MYSENEKIKQGTTLENSGVVLFAFGRPQYYQMAYNLIFSIKAYSPNVKIALFVDSIALLRRYCPEVYEYTYIVNELLTEDVIRAKRIDPALVKVSVYNYLPFEHNLYLDVDAVCIKDIEPLLNDLAGTGAPYLSHKVGEHKIEQGREIPSMQWAYADDIWRQYELTQDDILPAINSSFQYINICQQSQTLYETFKDLYINNPLPLNKLRMKWGGCQPDELYMNIALCLNKIDPAYNNDIDKLKAENGCIHFASKIGYSFNEIIEKYYFQSYYGQTRFTPKYYIDWLDRILQVEFSKVGRKHIFRISNLIPYKHANNG